MIIVIADDLSGAAELAGLAHGKGLQAEVQTVFDPRTNADVVAVDSDTRSTSAEQAAERVRELARRIRAVEPAWVYKKTDSVLRGHVRAELTALMPELNCARTLLIPANPSRGRIIKDGRYFVGQTPLDETLFANDPEYPARTSSVVDLLQREEGAHVTLVREGDGLPATGIAVPDANALHDLEHYASIVDGATLCAGAAEFFASLLSFREAKHPATQAPSRVRLAGTRLLVCGSAAGWPTRRRECLARGWPVFVIGPEAYSTGESTRRQPTLTSWSASVARQLAEARTGMIALGEPPALYERSPFLLLNTLVRAVGSVLHETSIDWLFLEGGATAAAVVSQMGWKRLAVEGHLALDLAAFFVSSSAPRLIIKPGSYPWPMRVWEQV